jgi:cysteinyl-tRNA synthetase
MAIVWEVAKKAEKSKDYYKLLCDFDKVLGLGLDEISKQEVKIPDEVQSLLSERRLAREEKDFKKSDELRDKIFELGFSVKDTKDGVVVEKI